MKKQRRSLTTLLLSGVVAAGCSSQESSGGTGQESGATSDTEGGSSTNDDGGTGSSESDSSTGSSSEEDTGETQSSADAGDGDSSGTGDGDSAGDGDGGGTGDGDGGGTGDSAGDGDEGGDGDSAGDGDGGGSTGDGDGDGEEPCQKVDFLFVIDNSVSMSAEQTQLTAAFPGFIAAIEATLDESDYHIMVVDTDAETRCTPANCAGSPHNTCEGSNGYACTASFEACDTVRGAGVIHPAGALSSNQLCDPMGDQRYIVYGEPDPSGVFECMATLGTAGHPQERPMDAIVEGLSPALNAPGACNEGFVREDAILVIVMVSDDPNVEDLNTAQQTYDAVVAAKDGNADAVVVMGLIPNPSNGCVTNNATAGAHWAEFIGMFGDKGIVGEVCDEDYVPFFQEAVAIIDETCDEFPIPE